MRSSEGKGNDGEKLFKQVNGQSGDMFDCTLCWWHMDFMGIWSCIGGVLECIVGSLLWEDRV